MLESRRGSTEHQNNPWFAVERGDQADEDFGEVWFGALAWSGSWRITVEQDQVRNIRINGGFNSFDFAYSLKPGEKLESPVFYGGFSREGIGERRGCYIISSCPAFCRRRRTPSSVL